MENINDIVKLYSNKLTDFWGIEENAKLLNQNDFEELYNKCDFDIYILTAVFLKSNIDFLRYMTKIPDQCFYSLDIQSITIPNNITSINYKAFEGCSGLKNITIPNSVTEIWNRAFEGCSGLKNITISRGVTRIGLSAFSGCSGLTSITIPNSIVRISYKAFEGCSSLKTIVFENTEENILKMCDDKKNLLRLKEHLGVNKDCNLIFKG